jgi:predicted ArsR family transcriptional regulator
VVTPSEFLRPGTLRPSNRLVLAVLVLCPELRTQGQAAIGNAAGLSAKGVRNTLRNLETLGWIRRHRRTRPRGSQRRGRDHDLIELL